MLKFDSAQAADLSEKLRQLMVTHVADINKVMGDSPKKEVSISFTIKVSDEESGGASATIKMQVARNPITDSDDIAWDDPDQLSFKLGQPDADEDDDGDDESGVEDQDPTDGADELPVESVIDEEDSKPGEDDEDFQ